MSDLIDRYVAAVAANLPKKDRAEVPAELRDVLMSKVEHREEELGRRLTAKEEEAVLREFGHPLEVAGRYGKSQQLIGPEVYPFYIFTLKVVMGIMVTIYLALWAMFVVTGVDQGASSNDVVQSLIVTFSAVTLTFVVIDRTHVIGKIARSWKPSQLPMMGAAQGRSPFTVLFEASVGVIVALWWVGVLKVPTTTAHSHLTLALAAIWDTLYWPVLAMIVAQVALDLFELVLPGLAKAHAIGRVIWHLAFIGLIGLIWQAGHWIDVTSSTMRPDLLSRLQANFDRGFKVGLAFAVVCALYEIWCAGRRFVRFERMRKAQLA